MKKILTFVLLLVLLFSSSSPVLAVTVERPAVDRMKNTSTGAKLNKSTDQTVESLKARAEKEINRRVASLNKLLTKIVEFKKLTSAQKTELSANVQEQINALDALLVKIKADTDITTLRTDVQSIVTSYRIYALFMPQIQIIGAAERMLNVAEQMDAHVVRLETKITELKTAGTDTTAAEVLLADMKAKIASAKTQAQGAIDAVMPLTPEGYPANRTTLQSARQMVVAALKDLNTARQDGRKIVVWLIQNGKSVTGTVTPGDSRKCPDGQELRQVQCITAPCPKICANKITVTPTLPASTVTTTP